MNHEQIISETDPDLGLESATGTPSPQREFTAAEREEAEKRAKQSSIAQRRRGWRNKIIVGGVVSVGIIWFLLWTPDPEKSNAALVLTPTPNPTTVPTPGPTGTPGIILPPRFIFTPPSPQSVPTFEIPKPVPVPTFTFAVPTNEPIPLPTVPPVPPPEPFTFEPPEPPRAPSPPSPPIVPPPPPPQIVINLPPYPTPPTLEPTPEPPPDLEKIRLVGCVNANDNGAGQEIEGIPPRISRLAISVDGTFQDASTKMIDPGKDKTNFFGFTHWEYDEDGNSIEVESTHNPGEINLMFNSSTEPDTWFGPIARNIAECVQPISQGQTQSEQSVAPAVAATSTPTTWIGCKVEVTQLDASRGRYVPADYQLPLDDGKTVVNRDRIAYCFARLREYLRQPGVSAPTELKNGTENFSNLNDEAKASLFNRLRSMFFN